MCWQSTDPITSHTTELLVVTRIYEHLSVYLKASFLMSLLTIATKRFPISHKQWLTLPDLMRLTDWFYKEKHIRHQIQATHTMYHRSFIPCELFPLPIAPGVQSGERVSILCVIIRMCTINHQTENWPPLTALRRPQLQLTVPASTHTQLQACEKASAAPLP